MTRENLATKSQQFVGILGRPNFIGVGPESVARVRQHAAILRGGLVVPNRLQIAGLRALSEPAPKRDPKTGLVAIDQLEPGSQDR